MSKINKYVALRDSSVDGVGLFALIDIAPTTIILRDWGKRFFVGALRETTVFPYFFSELRNTLSQPDDHKILSFGPTSFLNHSDNPNCTVSVEHAKGDLYQLSCTVVEPLKAGSELLLRYPDWSEPDEFK